MTGPAWRIEDEEGSPEITGAPSPLLVTGRALTDALRRTWRLWVAAAMIGAVLGVAASFAMPHRGSASTTLLMVHPEAGESAMTTDLNLLQTRSVASRVIADLDLEQSPEAFLSTVSATPVNEQILILDVSGPDDASAVDRAASLVDNFLEFRAEQLRSVSDGLVTGYQQRITRLRAQSDALTKEYQKLSARESADAGRLSEVLTARSTLGSELTRLQSEMEDAVLTTEAAITGTHVVDAPTTSPHGSRREVVLIAASGAILGAALTTGVILFRTLTSDRLRRRRDVAVALGVPVRVGVGPVSTRPFVKRIDAALNQRLANLVHRSPVSRSGRRRRRDLDALLQGLLSALPPRLGSAPHGSRGGDPPAKRRGGPTTLGLAAIDRTDTGADVLRTAAARLAERGVRVLLVDLTATGALSAAGGLSEPGEGPGPQEVYRPEGDPALTPGPRRSGRRPSPTPPELDRLGVAWSEADLVLALVDVDPGLDLHVLRTWVSGVVPLVSAGRASGELLSTIAALVAEAGLEIPFALLEGADRSDQTLGRPSPIVGDPPELGEVQSR